MSRELEEKKPESEVFTFSTDKAALPSKRRVRKNVAPEIVSEIRTRQRAIGAELRRLFDDVAREPVPQEFRELMTQIDRMHEG